MSNDISYDYQTNLVDNSFFNQTMDKTAVNTALSPFSVRSNYNHMNQSRSMPTYFITNSETINKDFTSLRTLNNINNLTEAKSTSKISSNSIYDSEDSRDENTSPKKRKNIRGPVKLQYIEDAEKRSKTKYKRTRTICTKASF